MFSLKEASSVAREPEIAAAIDAVERYLQLASGPKVFRGTQNADSGEAEVAAYRGLGGLGLASALNPEASGGSGFPPGVAALIGERLGWTLSREPFVENVILPSTLLRRLGAPPGNDSEIACVAWQESGFCFPEASAIRTTATVEGRGYRLCGTKRFVMGARASIRLLVLARLDGAPAILSVASSSAKREDKHLADGSTWSDVEFDCAIGHADVLARGDDCIPALTFALDLANLALAGLLHGLQSRILTMTLEYLGTREQFGKPLGSFQALQHRAVELYNHAQIARFLLGEAVDAVGHDVSPQVLAEYASRAKARTVDSAARIAREGIQLHGAIGFSDEYDLGLYVKRILVLSAWLGGATWHRRRYASLDAALGEG